MKLQYIPKEKQYIGKWSGGTTTELYIYPREGSYKEKKFSFRVSTAECMDETSDFTLLPDTRRILLVLEGKIKLFHSEKQIQLNTGEQESFLGDEHTKSVGKCTDFNLMLKGNASGSMLYQKRKKNTYFKIDAESDFTGIYVYNGEVCLETERGTCVLKEHDFCMAEREDMEEMLFVLVKKDSEIAILSVDKGEDAV